MKLKEVQHEGERGACVCVHVCDVFTSVVCACVWCVCTCMVCACVVICGCVVCIGDMGVC